MTSSYGNVIGTPEDEIPDISDTNYLKTGADMSTAVNERIEDGINDTKEFSDAMWEIEKNRQEILNKRLKSIKELAGDIGTIKKNQEANDLEKKLNDYKYAQDRKNRNELVNRADNEKSYNALKLADFIGDTEDPRIAEVQEVLNQLNFDLDEDVDLKTFLAKYEDKDFIGSIYSTALQRLGHGSLTNITDGLEMRRFVQQLIRNRIHVEALEKGFDINSGRYEKNLLKLVQPGIDTLNSRYSNALNLQIQTNLNADQKEKLNDKLRIGVRSINIKPENGQDLTTFTDKFSIIKQIAVAPAFGFNGDMSKATDYYFDQVASLLDGNEISIADATAVLENLPYTDFSTTPPKTYTNYNEYAESLDPDNKHYFKVANRIKMIDDAIERKHALIESEAGKAHAGLQRPYKEKVDALYQKASDDNRPINAGEAFKIIQEYYGDTNLWVEGHSIKGIKPKWLSDLETASDYLGNKDVDTILSNKALLNSFDKQISIAVAGYKKKTLSELDGDDYYLISILKDELTASLIRSQDPGGKSDFSIAQDNGTSPKLFIKTKLDELTERLDAGAFDAELTIKGSRLAYLKQDMIALAKKTKGDSIDSTEIHAGEAPWLTKTKLYIQSGGRLHPEVLDWWREFRVKDKDGTWMRPRELMYRRMNALGLFKETKGKGFYVDPKREFQTADEIEFERTNGIVGTITLFEKESSITGRKMGEHLLESWEYEGAKEGKGGLSGYNYVDYGNNSIYSRFHDFVGEKIAPHFGISETPTGRIPVKRATIQDLNVYRPTVDTFGGERPGMNTDLYHVAKNNPDAKFGKYGITGSQIVELFDQPAFKKYLEDNPTLKFDANFQDFLAFESMRFQLNRKQSIRGMKVEKGKLSVTDLTVFSNDEIEAMKEIFPRLADYKFTHLNMMSKPISDLVLTKLEKAQQLDEEKKTNKNVKAYKQNIQKEKTRIREQRGRLDFSEDLSDIEY